MSAVFNFYKHRVASTLPPCSALPPIAGMPSPAIGADGKPVKVNWKLSILSGGLAGGIEILITYPTEFIKTQLQLDYKRSPRKYSGSFDCIKQTIAERGPFGVYRGLSSLLAGSIPKAASRFWAYEQVKDRMVDANGKLTRPQQLAAGLIAGMTEAVVVVCPMETVKVKLIHDQNRATPQYRGLMHGVSTIVKQDGFLSLYQGLSATLVKQGSNQAIRFSVLHEYKRLLMTEKQLSSGEKVPIWINLSGGVVAGAASVLGNNPFDVIKTNMQGLQAKQYSGMFDCAKQIYAANGFAGFYKGCGPRFARVCGDVAIVFTLYDQISHALKGVKALQ